MSKKYVPSGYQIISINASDRISQTPFTPETEDEKILHKVLLSGSPKPILLTIDISPLGYFYSGIGTICDKNISLFTGEWGAMRSVMIKADEETLTISEVEE